jgi:subtilisin-like proprotein convertase family protein
VTWTVTDTSGNAATCQQRVIVVRTCGSLSVSALTNQVSCPGEPVTFQITANAIDPLSYVWRFNGQLIAGATTNVLLLPSIASSNAGTYSVVVSSPCVSVTNSATLTVLPPIDANPAGFTNSLPISIYDFATDPYPSVIAPQCVPGTVKKLTVTLTNFSHYFPGDVSLLLVAPNQVGVVLMAGVRGDDNPVFNVSLTFSDAAANFLPDFDPITNGIYKPTDNRGGSPLPVPAPQSGYASKLAAFNGADPNGPWKLYAYDDALGDGGSIGGWSLNFEWQRPLLLVNPRLTTNGVFQADVLAQSGVAYVVERSTNLTLWVPFLTNVFATNVNTFMDAQSPQFPRRFYRAMQ